MFYFFWIYGVVRAESKIDESSNLALKSLLSGSTDTSRLLPLLRFPPKPVPLKFGWTGALFASRIIKVESFLEEFESVSRSRDVRGVVGRETAPSDPPLLNKIESDIFRLELTLTVSFLTDCFGLRCVELNDESFYGFYFVFTYYKTRKND